MAVLILVVVAYPMVVTWWLHQWSYSVSSWVSNEIISMAIDHHVSQWEAILSTYWTLLLRPTQPGHPSVCKQTEYHTGDGYSQSRKRAREL